MANYLTQATLDIIGLAGFNYSFNALDNKFNELSSSFTTFVRFGKDLRFSPDQFIFQSLKRIFSFLKIFNIDQKSQEMERAHKRVLEISHQIVEEGKRNLGLDLDVTSTTDNATKIGNNKDILSLVLRANATDLGDGVHGLSTTELAHQIPTFLFAGRSK